MSEGFGEAFDSGQEELNSTNEYVGEPQGQQQEQQPNDNPAWNSWLESVPEEFHPHLKSKLSESDKYVQKVQQDFAPYKEFAEQGVNADTIKQWGQLAALFQNNPRGVAEYLNNQYNFFPTQQQSGQGQQQQSTNENLELGNEPEFDISKDPRFQQVANQAQLANSAVQQMQQMQIEQQVNAQLTNEFAQLDKEYPGIPRELIIKTALGNAAAKGPNVQADLIGAAKELQNLGIGRGAVRQAPPNLSGRSTGLPSSQVDPAKMSRADRNKYVAGLIAAMDSENS